MRKNRKNILHIFISSLACLITIVAFGLICSLVLNNDTEAAGVQLTIKKNEVVSIYVHGEYVELISSSETEDIYTVEEGTTVKLRAVNEARIFTGWTGLPDGVSATNSTVEFTLNEGATIDCTRRDPKTSDFGQYMNNRFVIYDASEVLAMTDILNDTAEQADYDLLFKGFTDYSKLSAVDKATYITNNKAALRLMVYNGYFLVDNNISLLEDGFTGIPEFNGVFSGGTAEQPSTIIATISTTEAGGTNYYGLFKELGPEALVRNLKLTTSIGITGNDSADASSIIYAGGLAGYADDPFISNVQINTRHGIVSNKSTVYAGGYAGILSGGISNHETLDLNFTESSWILTSNGSDPIYSGLLAATNNGNDNVYCHDIEINLDNTSAVINTSNNIYFGGLIGELESTSSSSFDDIVINSNGASFQSIIDVGTSYMGGLIGYVNTNSASVNVGLVRIIGTETNDTSFLNQTLDANSSANLYTGGLFGYINGTQLIATDSFKDSIHNYTVDGKPVVDGDYLFDGNFIIRSQNDGNGTNTTYGKTITAGVAAYGYFDINGVESSPTELLIHSNKGQMTIESIQSSQSVYTGLDEQHCLASLVFGLYSSSYFATTIQYIDVYATNVEVNAERQIGSKSLGDLKGAGFLCYADGTPFNQINLKINNVDIFVNSLSYDAKTGSTSNNVYCGGFVAHLYNSNYGSTNPSLNGVSIEGYDNVNYSSKGATFEINSIQNSTPGAINTNYSTENYCGGLVGQVLCYENISNVKINGASKETAKVIMQSHQDPDSAFCGGIIGLVRKTNNYIFNLTNAEIANVSILGLATNNAGYKNPDIYVGGAIGVTYFNATNQSASNITNNVSNVLVYNCNVHSISNDNIASYASGITAGSTWGSYIANYTNCYVESCDIYAKSDSNQEALAAGIIPFESGSTTVLTGCIVNNSKVTVNSSNGTSKAGGLICNQPNTGIFNCYVNADVYKQNLGNIYAVQDEYSTTNYALSYYKSNITTGTLGTTINLSPLQVSEAGVTFTCFDATETPYNTWKDFYPILKDTTHFTLDAYSANEEPVITSDGTNAAALVEIWYSSSHNTASAVNVPTSYASDYERNKNGWFKVGEVVVYHGTLSPNEPISGSFDIKFDNSGYLFSAGSTEVDGDRLLSFVGYEDFKIKSGYLHQTGLSQVLVTDKFTITDKININVFEGIEDTIIKFRVSADIPLLVPVLLNASGTEISKNPDMVDDYGTYTVTNSTVTVDGVNYRDYEIVYVPNPDAESTKFYMGFEIGSINSYSKKVIEFTINKNEKVFESVITAPYTPSINEQEQGKEIGGTTYEIGSYNYPYLLAPESTYKFIPVFTKQNDIEDILYDSDTNIQYVTYSLGSGGSTYATMVQNGELTTKDATSTDPIALTVTYNGTSKTIYFKVVSSNTVSFNIVGYSHEGLLDCNNTTNYHLYLNQYDNYHTIPDTFQILVGSTDITKSCDVKSGGESIVSGTAGSYLVDWSKNKGDLEVIIPANLIGGNITFNIIFPQVYTIRLHLNNSTFYPECPVSDVMEFRVVAGTSLKEYFGNPDSLNPTDRLTTVNTWANTDAALFGYLFNGFYLVDDASSINSYGLSFVDYVKNYSATTSIDFYGRWSFLIEIIEAPGTHIVPSFNADFLQQIEHDDYEGLIADGRVVTVPINANRGYVFTIDKDSDFIGEAAVEAFSVSLDGSNNPITSSITIERYHDNSYLYFIPPEKITGYLVIATSVSNSDFIVGENEAALNESIIPEDGVYTFKYVVNHRNDDIKSYIYSGTNLEEKRNLKITFKEQILEVTMDGDKVDNTLKYESRTIPVGTVIEIYYHSYIEGEYNNTVVGTYTVEGSPVSTVDLSEFKLLSLSSQAFNTEQTFADYLGSAKSFSEVFYISITPPNGYRDKVHNKVFNYNVEVGYVDDEGNYLTGDRTNEGFANIPLDPESLNLPEYILKESSKQTFLYSITPSRDTDLTYDEVNNQYTFKDYQYFNIYNVVVNNATLDRTGEKHFINLSGNIAARGTIKSSDEGVGFIINTISITAGYNEGNITVYGKNNGDADWVPVGVITVSDINYQSYTFNYSGYDYDCFALANLSGNEIHIQDITITDRANALPYKLDFSDYEESLSTYSINMDIKGDTRHDGKVFMLAVQLGSSSGFATNIPAGSKLIVGSNEYAPLDDTYPGRNVLYFNLSDILETEELDEIDFKLSIPSGYSIVSTLLYESESSIKPAMGEVRKSFVNGVEVTYTYVYKLSSSSSGSVTNTNSGIINSLTTLENPVDGDLVFGGWYEDEALTKPITTVDTSRGNMTLYGVFYPKDTTLYTVTFNYVTGGGTETSTVYKVPSGNFVIPEISGISKTGHNFTGWDKGATGATITISENTVIEAQYSINEYTVTFKDGDTVIKEITANYGTDISSSIPDDPTKQEYNFTGWSPAAPTTMPGNNLVVQATWTLKEFTITFNSEGSVYHQETIQYSKPIELPENPTREGYRFDGWDLNGNGTGTADTVPSTMPLNNLTYTAIWTKVYTIKFMSNGTTISTVIGIKGSAVDVPTVTREGYTFTGWDNDLAQNATTVTIGEADVTYTAQWNVNKYTLTFDTDGGSSIDSITADYGSTISITDPTKTGYTFLGWSPELPSTMPAENVTYTAQWKQYTINIIDSKNDGNLTTIMLNSDGTLTLPSYESLGVEVKDGYEYAGYSLGENDTTLYPQNTSISDYEFVDNVLNIYLRWNVRITFECSQGFNSVTYNINGGTPTISETNTIYVLQYSQITFISATSDGRAFQSIYMTDPEETKRIAISNAEYEIKEPSTFYLSSRDPQN